VESRLERHESRAEAAVAPGTELAQAARLLAQSLPQLVREEVALLKLQTRGAAIKGAAAGVIAVTAFLAALFLGVGASIAISQVLERTWAGPVVVGGGLAVLAAVSLPIVLRSRSE
jgi:hypothetical protein